MMSKLVDRILSLVEERANARERGEKAKSVLATGRPERSVQ